MVRMNARIVDLYKSVMYNVGDIKDEVYKFADIISKFNAKVEPIEVGNEEDGYELNAILITWKNGKWRGILFYTNGPARIIFEIGRIHALERPKIQFNHRPDPQIQSRLSQIARDILGRNLDKYSGKSKEELAKVI